MSAEAKADYSQMTSEEYSALVHTHARIAGTEALLAMGDVYTIVAEELNNEVLDAWAAANPDKAYPNKDAE